MWERIESLTNRALIGRWKFASHEKTDLMEWLLGAWEKILSYKPRVSKLEQGWFCFHLINDNDAVKILSRTWVNGKCFLALHRWDANFHPVSNAPVNHLVWVKLFGLPLQFWSTKVLEAIGDSIGRCRYIDSKCFGVYDKRAAWVLVEAPFAGGLPTSIDLAWNGITYKQCIDY